jgi:hypothetical protein
MKNIEGSCHCGSVHFKAAVDPEKVFVCHCTDCQTLSGSPFRVVALCGAETLKWLGEKPNKYVKTAHSGKRRVQAFCGTCGSPIYSSDDVESPAIYALRAGCIHQRDELQPKAQMWCQSTQQWLETLSDLPKFEKQLG